MTATKSPEPTVKARPTFRAGDTLESTATGESFRVESVTPAGDYICRGRAGALPAAEARKPLTDAQRAELAAGN